MHDSIENIYALTPLQKGLLLHEVAAPESRVYYQQQRATLRGALDLAAFRQAWAALMERHAVLRTAFVWEELDDAYQVVMRSAPLPLRTADLRGDTARLDEIAREDLAAFDLAQAPLMRLTLARVDEAEDGQPQWVLLWTHHHLLLDGWSVGLLLSDWCELYRAARRGMAANPEPSRPFHDYVAYLGERPVDDDFWKARLGDFAATTPVPDFDPRAPAPPGLPYAEHVHLLPADATARLTSYARSQSLTVNTVLQGAYAYLLGRHAGRDEALIGVTVAGRPDRLRGVERMVGLFINTLPLRVRWDDAPTVGAWLARIQDWNAEMRDHEHTPLAGLRASTALPPGAELFEAILVFENFPFPSELERIDDELVSLPDATEEVPLRHTTGRNDYPLSLIASLDAQGMQLRLVHRRSRLSDAAGARLLSQLTWLVQALAVDAARALAQVPLCPPEEQALVSTWGNGKPLPLPETALHALIEPQARRHPEREAVRDGERALNYAQLMAESTSLARHLRKLGLADGDVVALALPRCTQAVVSLLAVLQAGGCFLPLDLAQPASRLAAVVRAGGARFVIGRPAFDIGPAHAIDPADVPAEVTSNPLPTVSPDAPAYVIYTSGSTGTPKGVCVPHRAIVTYVVGIVDALGIAEASPWRHALLSTLAADLGYTQLFGALASGGSVLLVDDETRGDPQALGRLLAAFPPDLLKLTPGHLQGLLDAHASTDLLPRRALVLGGEALPAAVVDTVRRLAPGLDIYNHYGPTESAVGVTLSRIATPIAGVQPLGDPQPNRRLRVLDTTGQPVPVGMPGELYIGGAGLAFGYLGDDAQTAERYAPAADLPRAYRTGDRVRWLETGELAFLGRTDHQVKLRGHRIELGEVEAQILRSSPHIRQTIARVVHTEGEAPRLVAWFVADTSMSADKLRSDLAMRLPEAMVPSAFVPLDAFPLNANGKPDVARLPLPDAPAVAKPGHVAPRNETEALLAQIWQAVLRVERVSVHDDFFALGGDSILNLQIIARAHQHGLKLTPRQLFENRSIAQIAAVALCVAPQAAQARPEARTVPLTPGQWSRLEAGPLSPTWRCMALAHRPTLEVLTRALQAVQRHHQALQVGLHQTADVHWSQTLPSQPQACTVSVAPGDDIKALAAVAYAEMQHAAGAGLHACLLEDRDALLLVSHPLRLDEASWPLLWRDLSLALAQAMQGRPIELPRHGGDLSRFAEHQQRRAASEVLDGAWEYWLQHAGADMPRLPLDAAASAVHHVALPADLAERLLQLQRRSHAPWLAILTAAVAAELADALGDEAVWIEVDAGRVERSRLPLAAPLARTDYDPSRIVGSLTHPTPLRLVVPQDAARLLPDIDAQLAAAPHAGDDYGLLRYLSDNDFLTEPLRSLPRPQVGVAFIDEHDIEQLLATSPRCAMPKALQVILRRRPGGLHLECTGPLADDWAPRLMQRLAALAQSTATPSPDAFPLCNAQDIAALRQDPAFDLSRIEDLYPLSPMQEGMLLHTLLSPDSGIYLMQQRYRWDGALDRAALEWAWEQLLARHPILRTGFWWQDGQRPLQCVYRETDSGYAWYDLRGVDAPSQQRQIEAVLAAERHRGYDMRRPPLTGLRVFQLGEQQYLIVRSFHHILNDAWCFSLVMSDLFAHYQSRVLGLPAARPLPPPFRDFIQWLQRQDPQRTESFWREQLAGLAAPTPLVVDRPVGREHAVEDVAHVDASLSIAETRALDALCRQHQLTPNTCVQGAWALLLSRYSGLDDVLFGVTVAGRPADLPGVEQIVGLFINSLPLRVQIDDAQAVIPWLQSLLARNVALRDHEHTPLVQIQRWSEVEPGRPLFDSLVVFENAPFDAGLADRRLDFSIDIAEDRVHTNYAMTVVAYPGDRLGLRLSYDRARFDEAAVLRMVGHLRELLVQMVSKPDAPLGTLEMLTAYERQTLLVEWNRSEHRFPLDQTYAALFTAQAARHPDRIAAWCEGESLSYAELGRRSNCLAHALIESGATPGSLVALAAERGLPLLAMMIGVLKAGAAFLPLDVNHPPQRLAQILDLANAKVVLASDSAGAALDRALAHAAACPKVLRTERIWLHGDANLPPPAGTPDDLAYVIFTSGSTGTPKGAMVEQRGMLNNILGKQPTLGLSAQDRIAQTASPAFDISVWQFLAAPVLGAAVHILPDDVAHDPARLLQALTQQRITVLEAVPSMMCALLEACPAELTLPDLRWLLPTGEALPPSLARAWLARFPRVPLMNAYGPAECSDDVAFHAIAESPANDEPVPIGRPTPNNRLYLLDAAHRPVPVGVPGEIGVAGVGVGRGYLHDPEKTRAAFIDHPFEPGQRFYRTGDLGRWRADGLIEFLGRRDQQVKVRGHRIELGEIEERLASHPGVQTAALIARPDARGDRQLVAYWVSRGEIDAAGLREHLASQLPAYMVPAHFVRLDSLPLNANGKVDRRSLATREVEASPTTASVAPRTETEQRLAALWTELLGVARIGADDHFFALGGHSLLATQVVSRIRSRWQVELPLRAVFEHPTLSALARAIDAACSQPGAAATLPTIVPQEHPERLPLSFAQQRLWFLEQLQPGSSVFHIPFALTLTGPLDVPALQCSLQSLVDRHEVLRSTVHNDDGEPWQRIEPAMYIEPSLRDLRDLCEARDREAALKARLDAVFHQPFDLTRGPLLRAELLRLADERYVLALVLHHLAADAWSIALLVDDLSQAYLAYASGQPPAFTPMPLQYADYVLWQRRHLPGAVWQQQLGYWRRQLAHSPPPLMLPGATGAATHRAARHRRRLPPSLLRALRQQADEHGASLYMELHAALNVLLHQQTGRTDIAIGADVANRHRVETEGMVGFFVNQLVLRCRIAPEQRYTDLLAHCCDLSLAAHQHQDLPFDALVAEMLPQRDARHTPFFQVKLVLQNTPQRTLALPGIVIEEHELPPQGAELDLLINAVEDEDGLLLVYDHDAGRYPPHVIAAFDEQYVAVLEAVATDPGLRIAELVQRVQSRQIVHDTPRPAREERFATLGQTRRRAVTHSVEPASPIDP